MRPFLRNCIYAILLFQVVLYTVFYFAKKGLRTYNQPVFKQLDLLLTGNEPQDILFIGSSRTLYGVNPALLENLTHKKIMNAGLEGAKINEMEFILKGYLSTHPNPEKIFLMLDIHSLDMRNARIYNKLFLSQYLHNDSVYRLFREHSGIPVFFWKYLPYSIIPEFDDYTRSNCLKGLAGKTRLSPGESSYKGYITLNSTYTPEDSLVSTEFAADNNGMVVLARMAETCAARNIPLYILQGPYLEGFYRRNKIQSVYEKIHERLSAYPSVTTQTLSLNYSDTFYFKDQVHLNSKGADKYSSDIFNTFLRN